MNYWERVERIAAALLAAEQGRTGEVCGADVLRALDFAALMVEEVDRRRADFAALKEGKEGTSGSARARSEREKGEGSE